MLRPVPLAHALSFCLLAATAAHAEEVLSPDALRAFVTGHTVTGTNPSTGAVVGTVTYAQDGSSVLTLSDGVPQTGSYRFDGDSYCTRYATFRDNTENCFRLVLLGPDQAQAYYTDGSMALLLDRHE